MLNVLVPLDANPKLDNDNDDNEPPTVWLPDPVKFNVDVPLVNVPFTVISPLTFKVFDAKSWVVPEFDL